MATQKDLIATFASLGCNVTPTEGDPREAQLDALRARAVNDVTRAIMATGITLTFGQVDDLGDETMAWIGSRLGLSVTTTDRGVECRVTR